MSRKQPPLVTHIIHRLAVGGLENGLVNLINNMPPERYRHSVICLTDFTDFRYRIHRKEVPIIKLYKREGKDFGIYPVFWKILRTLRPNIVHTRNLAGLEYLLPAALARIPGRIHGEHGLDMVELDGSNLKYILLRRLTRAVVGHYITVSADLANWLVRTVGVNRNRVAQIYNGVDLVYFRPRSGLRPAIGPEGFMDQGSFLVGTVGRMEKVKDPTTLVRAFLHLLDTEPNAREFLRLVMIGDGSLLKKVLHLLTDAGAEDLAWLPGERKDIPRILRSLDLFVLPSLREGISNTILEAMATGLAVVATQVGGNPELVVDGTTGTLVAPCNPIAMAEAISSYLSDPPKLARHGRAGRERVEDQFSMESMVKSYLAVYDSVLDGKKLS